MSPGGREPLGGSQDETESPKPRRCQAAVLGVVYLSFLGVYEERHCIGAFSTLDGARRALWERPEWLREQAELGWAFLRDGQFGPIRHWEDIEAWVVDDPRRVEVWG